MTGFNSLVAKYGRRGLVIDSNLLILLLVGMTAKQSISSFKRTRMYSPEDFDLLVDFTKPFNKLTTPNILTEVSNLTSYFRNKENVRYSKSFENILKRFKED